MTDILAGGWTWRRTCEREASLEPEAYHGEPWWLVDCRPGDRAPTDKPAVERVRLDGWRELIHSGQPFAADFSFMPGLSWLIGKPGDWTVIHELHAIGVGGSGPFKLAATRHSNGQVRLEAYFQRLTDQGIISAPIVIDLGALVPDCRYDIRLAGRAGPDGYLDLFVANRLVHHEPAFGYGNAPLYPQFGIYRNARSSRQTMRMCIRSVHAG